MISEEDISDHWAHPPGQAVVSGDVKLGVSVHEGQVQVSVEDGRDLVALLRLSPRQADFLMDAVGMAMVEAERHGGVQR